MHLSAYIDINFFSLVYIRTPEIIIGAHEQTTDWV